MVPGRVIGQTIDDWERIWVLWADFIQICIVDAHVPFTIGFLDKDCIGEPVGISDLSDEAGNQEFRFFSSMAAAFSDPYFLLFWATGFAVGYTLSL